MERFEPTVLLLASSSLDVWVSSDERPKAKEAAKTLGIFSNECKMLGLSMTRRAVQRAEDLAKILSDSNYGEFQSLCSDILSRLRDELDTVHLMALTSKEANYYANWYDGWIRVLEKFPSTYDDIEEASKSLACNRATACVFHLMRVTEVGLKVLANELGIPYAPSWESYLTQIERMVNRKWDHKEPDWKPKEPFFREVLSYLYAVKVAWRNPTMHVVSSYTVEQSDNIFQAVRCFMLHIAAELKEEF